MSDVGRFAVQPLPGLDELRAWIAPGAGPRVTVHLPIQRAVPDVRQNAPLLERAARELEGRYSTTSAPLRWRAASGGCGSTPSTRCRGASIPTPAARSTAKVTATRSTRSASWC